MGNPKGKTSSADALLLFNYYTVPVTRTKGAKPYQDAWSPGPLQTRIETLSPPAYRVERLTLEHINNETGSFTFLTTL